jgi:hypothetical protein
LSLALSIGTLPACLLASFGYSEGSKPVTFI